MKPRTVRRMFAYMKPYKALLAGASLGALLSVPLGLLGPVFIGRGIDAIAQQGGVDFDAVLLNLAFLGATVLLSALLQWLMQVCTRKVSAYAAQEMRRQAFARIHMAPLRQLDRQAHGDLVNRLINDADAVGEGFLQGLTQLFPGIVTILSTIILMLVLNVRIALIVILVTPLSILFARIITRRTGKLFLEQSVEQGKISAASGEMVANQNIVSVFGYEDEAMKDFEIKNESYRRANFLATLYSSFINPGTRFVNALVYAAVGVFGAFSALSGGITIGQISTFLAYANQYTKPFNEVTAVFTQLQSAVAGARRLFEVIDWEAEVPDAADAKAPAKSEGAVDAAGVYFSYDPSYKLIQDFTMHVKPGQRIALVGATGSGKTTIINLLMRFYDVDAGEISVDHTPITAIRRNALRSLYGMVLQDTWLKQATVHDNIAYSRPDATRAEVEAVARAAYADRFIKRLPEGYDTLLDTGGGNLSAGQKQLLCIARIMLARPDMLILDEATSSVDTRTEMLIQKALERLMHDHTSFIVAHRLSTIRNADMILVMDAGRIVERGGHEELLKKGGAYARLYNSQFAVQE